MAEGTPGGQDLKNGEKGIMTAGNVTFIETDMQKDPEKNSEAYLRAMLRRSASAKGGILVVTHDLGGGADRYLDRQRSLWLAQGNDIFLLRYVAASGRYRLECTCSGESFEAEFGAWGEAEHLLGDCAIHQIIVNELVSFPEVFGRLSAIRAWKREKKARLTMLIHDYFAVSPAYNLVSPQDWVYAREGSGFHCDRFYERDGWAAYYDCPSVREWRERWGSFLLACDEVRCFSEDSRRIMSYVYPQLQNITVIPHVVTYMPQLRKEGKTTDTLNIGILGIMTRHKGIALVRGIWELLARENPAIKLVLIGYFAEEEVIPNGVHFEATGEYDVADLPRLVMEKDIDLFLVPSICPETFSYTTEEILKMGLPIACLDRGAPAERVRQYDKGLVLSSADPRTVLMELRAFARALHLCPGQEQTDEQEEMLTQQERRLERERVIRRELVRQQNRQFAEQEQLLRERQAHIEQLEAQNQDLAEAEEARQRRIAQLEEHTRQLQESFDTISHSTSWKLTKPVRVVLDFVKSLPIRSTIRLLIHSLRVYGIRTTAERIQRHLRQRNYEKKPAKHATEKPSAMAEFPSDEERTQTCLENGYTADAKENLARCARSDRERILPGSDGLPLTGGLTAKAPLSVDVTVSVIIPTYNGGKDLPGLLDLLSKQVDVREIEIIVVDSGSTDDTLTIAAAFGAKIIPITQAEFSHSFARNLGARHASGEYLLFMTQDAKPGSAHWVRDMAQPIVGDMAVAVSCRQEPRDDCDLMGRFSLWTHYSFMGILQRDRVLSMPTNHGYDAMRRNSQLDDVACMIRRDVFSQFAYRGDFAEDMDLGLRLIKKGYRLSLLSGTYVVHSHNRPAFYYLKRCLVDTMTLKQLFDDFPVEKLTEKTATNRIMGMTAAIWHYVRELTQTQNNPTQRRSFFAWSTRFFDAEKQKLRVLRYEDFAPIIREKPLFCDDRFFDFIQDLYCHASGSFRVNTDWLELRRNSILKDLEAYLAYTGEPFTKETIDEIAELFVKHCGQAAGETLAYYAQTHAQEASFLNEWVQELRRGV